MGRESILVYSTFVFLLNLPIFSEITPGVSLVPPKENLWRLLSAGQMIVRYILVVATLHQDHSCIPSLQQSTDLVVGEG